MKRYLSKLLRSRKLWQRAAFSGACLATAIAAAYAIENDRGETAWRRYEASARPRGVKLYLEEIALPKVPDEENFAATPTMAAMFVPVGSGDNLPDACLPPEVIEAIRRSNFDLSNLNLEDIRSGFIKAGFLSKAGVDPAQDILQALDRYTPRFSELRQASKRPKSQYPQPSWSAEDCPSVGRLLNLSRLLQLHLTCALAVGKTKDAAEDFRIQLRICEALNPKSALLECILRTMIFADMISGPAQGTAAHAWNESELSAIENDLGSIDLRMDLLAALDGERAYHNSLAQEFLAHPNLPPFKEEFGWPRVLFPRGWVYQNLLSYNAWLDAERSWLENYIRANEAGQEPSLQDRFMNHRREWRPYRILSGRAHFLLKSHYDFVCSVQYTIDSCRVACALERFRLKNGAYPEQLAQLVPDELPGIPEDHFGKGPFHYRRDESGNAKLYAITRDGGAEKEETLWPPEPKHAAGRK
jgi:hypothetical protein